MVHIVFDKDDGEALKKSFDLDETLAGEVVIMNEDWSIGPIMGTINSEGETTTRDEWMAKLFRIQASEENTLEKIKSILKENDEENIWIWIAPNSRDVCGYYFLVSNLESFKGRVYSLWLNNLPFINDKGQIFYPSYLSEIPPKEFVKTKRLAQQISGATFETDPDEWKKLQRENKLLRILEGARKIAGKPENFFDKEILGHIQNDWQKSQKIVQQILTKSKGLSNKIFILWRLRELIDKNEIEGRGEWPVSENFEIKKPSTVSTEIHE